ncbi:MAG: hypothetical protein ACI8TA_000458 [Cyclobacteriaceae bacterium]|jgi:hypothetical protein
MKTSLLIVDFGLVILIWMTQLIIYPSFKYYDELQLVNWHQKYTVAISFIVMPLMLMQVALHGYQLYTAFNWLTVLAVLLIILTWLNTFAVAVPLHNQITTNTNPLTAAEKLVNINWYRTIMWSLVFLIGLINNFKTIFK